MPNTPVPLTTLKLTSQGGTFTTFPGVTSYKIRRRGLLGGTNRINYVRNQWDVTSRVQVPNDSGLSGLEAASYLDTQCVILEAVVRDYMDVVFSLGSTANLISLDCTSGTHVGLFEWLPGFDGVNGSGVSQVLYRSFHLVVWGDFIVTNADTEITQYRDSLTARGGGFAKIVPVGSLNGAVQPQQVRAFTPFWVTQGGYAEGLLDYPDPPTPQFFYTPGVYYDPESLEEERYTPKVWGINQNTGFGIRWNFRCWSGAGLVGTPLTF